MVKVFFKLSDVGLVEVEITQPESLHTILDRCSEIAGIQFGGYIAVRNGNVVVAKDSIDVNDVIVVFPAISGG